MANARLVTFHRPFTPRQTPRTRSRFEGVRPPSAALIGSAETAACYVLWWMSRVDGGSYRGPVATLTPRYGLSLGPDCTNKAVLQMFPRRVWPRDCGRSEFGILVAVDGSYFFRRHSRIRVRKFHAVVRKAARQHFRIDHDVAFPPSSPGACVVGSALCCAANRLGVVSAAGAVGLGGSSFFATAGSGFEACCVVFTFWRPALAAASISALASAKVLPSAR